VAYPMLSIHRWAKWLWPYLLEFHIYTRKTLRRWHSGGPLVKKFCDFIFFSIYFIEMQIIHRNICIFKWMFRA
jgi:hypothetical protein